MIFYVIPKKSYVIPYTFIPTPRLFKTREYTQYFSLVKKSLLGILPNTKKNEFKNVKYDLRRINEKSYQIVIMDDSIKLSQKATQKIYEALLYEYESYGFYIWTEYSGTSPPSAWKKCEIFFK